MILSNTAIFAALDEGRLRIVPEPSPRLPQAGGAESPFGSSAVDLTLGPSLRIPVENLGLVLDPSSGNTTNTLRTLYNTQPIDPLQGYILKPGRFLLANTAEAVTLPLPPADDSPSGPWLAARVEGRSSLARMGLLVHFTAPTIHAGFSGNITLEMMNLGPAPILLQAGMRICQLIVEEVSGTPAANPSQFQGQRDPTG